MSWTVANVPVDLEVLPEDLPLPALEEDAYAQVEAACRAVNELIRSGALGRDKQFRVSLSGHANPDHEPRGGYANDMISVSVVQL